jgi:hypothetical protein
MEKRVYKEFFWILGNSCERVFSVLEKQFVTKIYLRVKIKELLNNCFLIVGMSWVLEVYWRMARPHALGPSHRSRPSCAPLFK